MGIPDISKVLECQGIAYPDISEILERQGMAHPDISGSSECQGAAFPGIPEILEHLPDDWSASLEHTLDRARPEAVERRRAKGYRTARKNLDALCDPGSFVEYGQLAVAAQRRRR